MHLVLEDVTKNYFMTLIPKLHILTTWGKKSGNLITRNFLHVPCEELGCGPSAHNRAARNRTVAMRACKHVEKISSGPLAH